MGKNSPIECRIAEECLAGRIRTLNRVVTGVYDDALRPFNVRLSQMGILVAVAAGGPILAVDLCRKLRMEKSTLSRDLKRLVARQWIRVGDGRSKPLEITESGRALIRTVAPAWEAAQEQAVAILGSSLTKELFKAMDQMRARDADS